MLYTLYSGVGGIAAWPVNPPHPAGALDRKQQLRTISRGGLPPPPSSAGRRHSTDPLHRSPMDCPRTAHGLPRPDLWSHLGALLVVFSGSCSPSWASYVALGALLGPPNAPLSSNLNSDKPTWRQHWPQLASQANFSIDRYPSEPAKSLIFLRKTMVFAGWRCLLSNCAWTAVS